jgi:hypothetical protein
MPMIPRASSIFAGNVCSNDVATRKILKNGWNRERGSENPEQRLGIEFVSRKGGAERKTWRFCWSGGSPSSKLLGHTADSLPLAQIQSERASSPAGVLFYQPQSAACDGKWHKISVNLRRPKKLPLFSSRCSGPSAMQAASKAPLRAPYSCRKAFMGSTRAARRAGMYAASTATAKTTGGTMK